MPLVFSSIVPHSPLLIPGIGKENSIRLKNTVFAINKLEEKLRAAEPDVILIISPHGPIQQNAFTMNLNPVFEASVKEFGDFASKLNLKGNIGLTHKIKESLETKAPLQLTSEFVLDYGSSIPLLLLAKNLPNIKIMPLYYSGLDLSAHFQFGKLLKKEIMASQERIAVIASGDLSHRLAKNSPAGYSAKGKKFDRKIIELLTKKKSEDILMIDQDLIADAGECGLKSIVVLLGIMDGIGYRPNLLSYEAPFGVGYMAMNYKI